MTRKTLAILACGTACTIEVLSMFAHPISAIDDLLGAISFGVCGFIIGEIIR